MATRLGRRTLLFAVATGAASLAFVESGCRSKGCVCSWLAKPPAEPPSATDVEMLATGTDPRVSLRVARWTGLRYRTTLAVSGALGLEGAPPLVGPTTTMVVDNEVLRGSADPMVERRYGGLVRLIEERSVLRSLSVQQVGVPQPILDFWNQALLPFRGTTYIQHVAESAEVTQLTSETLGGIKPPDAVKKAVDQVLEQQRHFPFRLPPVPVGVGARWRFHEELELNNAHVSQVAEMTLKSVDANTVVVGIIVRQDAPRQSVPHPLNPSTSAVLEQYRGEGDGELVVDRLTAILLKGRVVINARSTLSGEVAGKIGRATMVGASTVLISAAMLSDEDAAL